MMIIFKQTQENTLFVTQKHNLLIILKYLIEGSQKAVFVGHDQRISIQVVTFFFAAWSVLVDVIASIMVGTLQNKWPF